MMAHGVENNRVRVLIGADAWVLDKLVQVTGSGYQRLIAAVSKRTGF
ncbi:MAG: hypothetical protein ABWX74_04125 [Aeromicrobium sp.]